MAKIPSYLQGVVVGHVNRTRFRGAPPGSFLIQQVTCTRAWPATHPHFVIRVHVLRCPQGFRALFVDTSNGRKTRLVVYPKASKPFLKILKGFHRLPLCPTA